MWPSGWRDRIWSQLDRPWDLIVIGGGITGAGLLREAVRAGLRTLLLEAGDFGSGTSSRSSKLVHGGLRYLKQGEIRLTLESVRERERLLREGRGLVNPLGFLLPNYAGDRPPGWVFGAGLALYDVLALKWGHRHYDLLDLLEFCPPLRSDGLQGGYRYFDALTDDARLVLRVIREAVRGGGTALSYARVDGLLRTRAGQVCGVRVRDLESPSGRSLELQAPVVLNATGAWADELRPGTTRRRLRQLRGSHLILPAARLPVRRAVSFLHPRDRRPVFLLPWEGVALFGTTDVDHAAGLQAEPAISGAEAEYLLQALRYAFPALDLTLNDVQATYAGVRPVVDTGQVDPSRESREHVLWDEAGLLTVTGGKLTTFRRMAHAALQAVRGRLPGHPRLEPRAPMLETPPPQLEASGMSPALRLRLLGRHGAEAPEVLQAAQPGDLELIPGAPDCWAEVRWAARAEGVVHLDDLLLRRVRLGLLLPGGGQAVLGRVRQIAQPELGWDDARWAQEAQAYAARWEAAYRLPR